MNPQELLTRRLPRWSDWVTLGFMSLAAPWIAACIHSVWVFHRGTGLYNAEVGGLYFHGRGPFPAATLWSLLPFIGACGVYAIPTLLVFYRLEDEGCRVGLFGFA
jgi:hypothetical protein